MKVSKRIITFFLAVAMLFSLFTFASASSSSGLLVDITSVGRWDSFVSQNGELPSEYWTFANDLMSRSKIGSIESLDRLYLIVDKYDTFDSGLAKAFAEIFSDLFTHSDYIVMFDDSLGVYRPYDNNAHIWFVNSLGHFPYYRDPSGSGSSGTPSTSGNAYSWWLRTDTTGISIQILPQDDLKSIAKRYSGYVRQIDDYYMILDPTGSKVLCAAGGHRLAAYVNVDQTAAGQTNNYYTQEGDTHYHEFQGGDTIINEGDKIVYEGDEITNNTTNVFNEGDTFNNQFINIHDNTFQNADGSIYNIDNLTWNPVTQSYYVNAHDEYVYNSTTNEYTTNNYTFQVTYQINYTSITHIGQTEEYEADTYVYYYELPDGRSSADLTAEDLEQLSLSFADVVNYARSTEEGSLRGLYHFDGNVEDSSYWSYCTGIDWDYGASLTYLDEGAFNGSLYLDEQSHLFYVNLPNERDLSGDFTIQFRYYQSGSSSTSTSSCISLGNPLESAILRFTGSNLALPDGTAFYPAHSGSWNEICIMRADGVIYYYVNGVSYSVMSWSDDTAYSDRIAFYFSNDQKCYRKIDELRITRAALHTPGVDYIPASVPYDTNLSLILPDGEQALADEVLVFTPSENNVLNSFGMSDWTSGFNSSVFYSAKSSAFGVSGNPGLDSGFKFLYNPDYTTVSDGGGYLKVSCSDSGQLGGSSSDRWLMNGLFLSLCGYRRNDNNIYTSWDKYCYLTPNKYYVFSIVYTDGTSDIFSFKLNYNDGETSNPYSVTSLSTTGVGRCNMGCNNISYTGTSVSIKYRFGLVVHPKSSDVEIAHFEIVEGTSPQFTTSWETAYYSSGQLEDSPVLAVRSNTPISSYVFGGVRPVYPERGQVWAMIENSRIVSLQQYTGSAWVEVDGRIWTGQRWIPYSSFDVFTLKDLYDIVGGSGGDYEYIYTEAGFWKWLQGAWKQMLQKLDAIILALGGDPNALPGDSSGNDPDKPFWQRVKGIFENALAKVIEALLDLITRILDLVLGVLYDLLEFFFEMLTDAVINGIGGFFDALTDEVLLQFFHTEEPLLDEFGQPVLDENGDPVMVPVVQLPAGVAGVFAFISAAIMVLPEELRLVMFFGIGALFLLAVLKLIRT